MLDYYSDKERAADVKERYEAQKHFRVSGE